MTPTVAKLEQDIGSDMSIGAGTGPRIGVQKLFPRRNTAIPGALSSGSLRAPTPNISVAFNSAAAISPEFRAGNSRSAASYTNADPTAAANGPNSRTPMACSPASAVPAQIHIATIGG